MLLAASGPGMCPGLVWLPVALKKCFDSARVGGFSSHSYCCQEVREGPSSAQRGLWDHLGDRGTQGKVRAKCTHTREQVARGKFGDRESACQYGSEVLFACLTTCCFRVFEIIKTKKSKKSCNPNKVSSLVYNMLSISISWF